ncbi:MAG: hypothetical protein J5I92_00295 [Thiogranum sp.]|nr:hypothetical protein [Thiogranum sp.]
MSQSSALQLSIGDVIPRSRFSRDAFSGKVKLAGKPVQFDISVPAMRLLAESASPVSVELELYFSCLVRKQMRFRELDVEHASGDPTASRTPVVPGLFASFRAVTTQVCRIADVDGKPPVQTLPVKKSDLFVPDWVRIDYRAGKWRGEFGFERNG